MKQRRKQRRTKRTRTATPRRKRQQRKEEYRGGFLRSYGLGGIAGPGGCCRR